MMKACVSGNLPIDSTSKSGITELHDVRIASDSKRKVF